MTVQEALKAALRDIVGPAARSNGFKGSAPNWRRFNDLGDCSVVNVQSSMFSTNQLLRCVINVSVAPQPWLDWLEEIHVSSRKTVGEEQGLYRKRLHPTGSPARTDGWWELRGPEDATEVAADMVRQLDRAAWPLLLRLLDREELLAQIRTGDLGYIGRENFEVFFARAEALLLADRGPSRELDEVLEKAMAEPLPEQRADAERFDAWVRARASEGCA